MLINGIKVESTSGNIQETIDRIQQYQVGNTYTRQGVEYNLFNVKGGIVDTIKNTLGENILNIFRDLDYDSRLINRRINHYLISANLPTLESDYFTNGLYSTLEIEGSIEDELFSVVNAEKGTSDSLVNDVKKKQIDYITNIGKGFSNFFQDFSIEVNFEDLKEDLGSFRDIFQESVEDGDFNDDIFERYDLDDDDYMGEFQLDYIDQFIDDSLSEIILESITNRGRFTRTDIFGDRRSIVIKNIDLTFLFENVLNDVFKGYINFHNFNKDSIDHISNKLIGLDPLNMKVVDKGNYFSHLVDEHFFYNIEKGKVTLCFGKDKTRLCDVEFIKPLYQDNVQLVLKESYYSVDFNHENVFYLNYDSETITKKSSEFLSKIVKRFDDERIDIYYDFYKLIGTKATKAQIRKLIPNNNLNVSNVLFGRSNQTASLGNQVGNPVEVVRSLKNKVHHYIALYYMCLESEEKDFDIFSLFSIYDYDKKNAVLLYLSRIKDKKIKRLSELFDAFESAVLTNELDRKHLEFIEYHTDRHVYSEFELTTLYYLTHILLNPNLKDNLERYIRNALGQDTLDRLNVYYEYKLKGEKRNPKLIGFYNSEIFDGRITRSKNDQYLFTIHLSNLVQEPIFQIDKGYQIFEKLLNKYHGMFVSHSVNESKNALNISIKGISIKDIDSNFNKSITFENHRNTYLLPLFNIAKMSSYFVTIGLGYTLDLDKEYERLTINVDAKDAYSFVNFIIRLPNERNNIYEYSQMETPILLYKVNVVNDNSLFYKFGFHYRYINGNLESISSLPFKKLNNNSYKSISSYEAERIHDSEGYISIGSKYVFGDYLKHLKPKPNVDLKDMKTFPITVLSFYGFTTLPIDESAKRLFKITDTLNESETGKAGYRFNLELFDLNFERFFELLTHFGVFNESIDLLNDIEEKTSLLFTDNIIINFGKDSDDSDDSNEMIDSFKLLSNLYSGFYEHFYRHISSPQSLFENKLKTWENSLDINYNFRDFYVNTFGPSSLRQNMLKMLGSKSEINYNQIARNLYNLDEAIIKKKKMMNGVNFLASYYTFITASRIITIGNQHANIGADLLSMEMVIDMNTKYNDLQELLLGSKTSFSHQVANDIYLLANINGRRLATVEYSKDEALSRVLAPIYSFFDAITRPFNIMMSHLDYLQKSKSRSNPYTKLKVPFGNIYNKESYQKEFSDSIRQLLNMIDQKNGFSKEHDEIYYDEIPQEILVKNFVEVINSQSNLITENLELPDDEEKIYEIYEKINRFYSSSIKDISDYVLGLKFFSDLSNLDSYWETSVTKLCSDLSLNSEEVFNYSKDILKNFKMIGTFQQSTLNGFDSYNAPMSSDNIYNNALFVSMSKRKSFYKDNIERSIQYLMIRAIETFPNLLPVINIVLKKNEDLNDAQIRFKNVLMGNQRDTGMSHIVDILDIIMNPYVDNPNLLKLKIPKAVNRVLNGKKIKVPFILSETKNPINYLALYRILSLEFSMPFRFPYSGARPKDRNMISYHSYVGLLSQVKTSYDLFMKKFENKFGFKLLSNDDGFAVYDLSKDERGNEISEKDIKTRMETLGSAYNVCFGNDSEPYKGLIAQRKADMYLFEDKYGFITAFMYLHKGMISECKADANKCLGSSYSKSKGAYGGTPENLSEVFDLFDKIGTENINFIYQSLIELNLLDRVKPFYDERRKYEYDIAPILVYGAIVDAKKISEQNITEKEGHSDLIQSIADHEILDYNTTYELLRSKLGYIVEDNFVISENSPLEEDDDSYDDSYDDFDFDDSDY